MTKAFSTRVVLLKISHRNFEVLRGKIFNRLENSDLKGLVFLAKARNALTPSGDRFMGKPTWFGINEDLRNFWDLSNCKQFGFFLFLYSIWDQQTRCRQSKKGKACKS